MKMGVVFVWSNLGAISLTNLRDAARSYINYWKWRERSWR